MQPTKVMCHGTQVLFFCHSPESPDFIWKPLIERTVQKWKQLTNDDKFFSAYMQGNLIFLLCKKDNDIQIHHWLKPDGYKVPDDIKKIANDLQSTSLLNQGLFSVQLQPWKNAD